MFFNKGDAASILMKGRRSMDAAFYFAGMQNSGCSGDAILGSSRLTHGSPLVVEDADFRMQPLSLVNWCELKTQP